MKIAVGGKGGSGKTIVSGTIARSLGRDGYDVLAIDDDDNPNLAVSLGVGREREVPPVPDEYLTRVESDDDEDEGGGSWELTAPPRDIVEEYGIDAPDGVTLLRAGRVEAGEGAFGYSHVTVFRMLSEIDEAEDELVLLDMAAGLGTPGMSKLVDALVMVVQPSYNSLETARKLDGFATEYETPDVRLVANDVRTDRDRAVVERYCEKHGFDVSRVIPNDDSIRRAELAGTAPVDYDGTSPAVGVIRDLADDLAATHGR